MLERRRTAIWLALAVATWAPVALAVDPLAAGAATREHAGLGVLVDTAPTSLLTNPARLGAGSGAVDVATKKAEVYSELSLISLDATYNHPGFEPFVYRAVAPVAALGGDFPVGESLRIGLVAVPQGADSKVQLNNLPVDVINGTSGESHVSTTFSGYDIGFGATAKLGEQTTLGLSLVQSYRHDVLHITIDDVAPTFDDANITSNSTRFVLGGSETIGNCIFAGSLSPAVTQRYHGTSSMPALGYPDPYPVTRATYSPLTVMAGLSAALGDDGTLNLETAYARGSDGRTKAQSGMNPNDSVATNLKSTTSVSLSFDEQVLPQRRLVAGLGFFPGDEGGGLYPGSRGADDHGEDGLKFGDFDGLTRYAAAFGLQQGSGAYLFDGGAFASFSSGKVGANAPQQGTYTLTLYGVTLSISRRW